MLKSGIICQSYAAVLLMSAPTGNIFGSWALIQGTVPSSQYGSWQVLSWTHGWTCFNVNASIKKICTTNVRWCSLQPPFSLVKERLPNPNDYLINHLDSVLFTEWKAFLCSHTLHVGLATSSNNVRMWKEMIGERDQNGFGTYCWTSKCINHKQRVKTLNLIVVLPSLFLRELRLDEVSVGAWTQ